MIWLYRGELEMLEEWERKRKKYSRLAKTSFLKKPTLKQKLAKFVAMYYELCLEIAEKKIEEKRKVPEDFEELPPAKQIEYFRHSRILEHPIFEMLLSVRRLEEVLEAESQQHPR